MKVGKFFILHISTILDVRKTKKMDMVVNPEMRCNVMRCMDVEKTNYLDSLS